MRGSLAACVPAELLSSLPHGWLCTFGRSNSSVVAAADAAKRDPEQYEIWRQDPAKFSFDGRYPLLEVYDKAKEAWKGTPA